MTTYDWIEIGSQLVPTASIGFLVGLANYFRTIADDDKKPSFYHFMSSTISSLVISIGVYGILSHFEVAELPKLGVATLVAFLGFDKVIEVYERIKKGNPNAPL